MEAWIVREMCGKGDLQGLAHQISLYNADGTPNLALVLEVALVGFPLQVLLNPRVTFKYQTTEYS